MRSPSYLLGITRTLQPLYPQEASLPIYYNSWHSFELEMIASLLDPTVDDLLTGKDTTPSHCIHFVASKISINIVLVGPILCNMREPLSHLPSRHLLVYLRDIQERRFNTNFYRLEEKYFFLKRIIFLEDEYLLRRDNGSKVVLEKLV